MTDSENLQTVKDTLAGLPPEERMSLLTEVVKTQLSDEHQKDVATETAKTLPDELQKDTAAETVRSLPDELQKVVAAETAQGLPAEDKKDIAAEALRDLTEADRKDIAAGALRDLAAADRKDLAISAVGTLAPEEQRDVGQMLLPEQAIVNRIWMMVVTTFCAILPLSAAGVFYAAITGSAGTQTILIVFTSTASLLAGLLAGRGLLASVLGRRGP